MELRPTIDSSSSPAFTSFLGEFGLSIDFDRINIALLGRAKRVLLIIGFGSYIIYRAFGKFLNRDLLWTLIDQVQLNLLRLNRHEFYLLNPSKFSPLLDKVCILDAANSLPLLAAGDTEDYEIFECAVLKGSSSPPSFAIGLTNDRVRNKSRYRVSKFRRCESSISIPCFNSAHESKISARSLCSPSLISRNRKLRRYSHVSEANSERSATLRLLWDEPEWDEEFDVSERGIICRGRSSLSSSNVSDRTEFREAFHVFDASTSTFISNRMRKKENNAESNQPHSDSASISAFESSISRFDPIEYNCMVDSKHLYQIVTDCANSDGGESFVSECSSKSFHLLRCHAATMNPRELLGLTQLLSYPEAKPSMYSNSMTDSAVSRGTMSTVATCDRFIDRCSMKDSAISMNSGDDYTNVVIGISAATVAAASSSHRMNQSIIRRCSLNLINEDEKSYSQSQLSLEWDEEFGSNHLSNESAQSSQFDKFPPFTWKSKLDEEDIHAKMWSKYYRKNTRDFMAWAIENYSLDQIRIESFQRLYSDRCFKRIGVERSQDNHEHFILSFLQAMLHQKITFFTYSGLQECQECITDAFSRFDFLRDCHLSKGTICVDDNIIKANSLTMKKLKILQSMDVLSKAGERTISINEYTEWCCVEAIKFLIVLHLINAFEAYESKLLPKSSVYIEIFDRYDLRSISEKLFKQPYEQNELLIVADAFNVNLEVIDTNCIGDSDPGTLAHRIYSPEGFGFGGCDNYRANGYFTKSLLTFVKAASNMLYPLFR